MSTKQLMFEDTALVELKEGVNRLARAVSATMGPTGRNVVIQKSYGGPTVTKDGVSVAKEIELPEAFQNMGAKMIQQVAKKTNDKAGDGTTCATVLAASIFTEGLRQIAAGARLGISLAPQLSASNNTGQVFLLLGVGTKSDNRWPGQALTNVTHPSWRACSRILLEKDHLLLNRTGFTAVLLRPTHTGPAAFCELLLPNFSLLRIGMLVSGTATVPELGKLTLEIILKPAGDFRAELLIFSTETQLHDCLP